MAENTSTRTRRVRLLRPPEPDIVHSTGATLMHRKTVINEAIQYLSILELDPISRISKFHHEVVKAHFPVRLSRLLKRHLIRGNFIRVMKKHNVVISGSSVFEFMDPAFASSWAKLGVGANDMDLYVKRGDVASIVNYLCSQRGVSGSVVFSSHEAIPGIRWDVSDVDGDYDVNGIKSVVKVKLVRGAKTEYIDVVESSTSSPIYPIMHFDLSICRNALMADGLAVYHADWTFKNIAYLCPMVSPLRPDALATLRAKTVLRIEKYTKRGVMIYEDVRVSPRSREHKCGVDFSCPHTLRDTGDSGVFFLPFRTMDELEKKRCKSAYCDPIMWRCGGTSCDEVSGSRGACAFRAPNLHGEFENSTSSRLSA